MKTPYLLLISFLHVLGTYWLYSLRAPSSRSFLTSDVFLFAIFPFAIWVTNSIVMVTHKRIGQKWAFRRTLIALCALLLTCATGYIGMVIALNRFGS